MGKVISFRKAPAKLDTKSMCLMSISDDIDHLILQNLRDSKIEAHELAGLLAHRLGKLLHHIGGEDPQLIIDTCQQILSKQAHQVDVV